MAKPLPDAKRLRALFHYEADTGDLFRITDAGQLSDHPLGKNQGSTVHRQVSVDGKNYLIHRVIWKIVHGKDPLDVIDHIDGNPLNNRLSNLREADWSQNRLNSALSTRNKSGVKGVFRVKGTWRATIAIDRRNVILGHFQSFDDAVSVVAAARRKHHAEFCRFS